MSNTTHKLTRISDEDAIAIAKVVNNDFLNYYSKKEVIRKNGIITVNCYTPHSQQCIRATVTIDWGNKSILHEFDENGNSSIQEATKVRVNEFLTAKNYETI